MTDEQLRKALNALNPERPLRTEQELRDLFVPRPGSPIKELHDLLRNSDDPVKILFSGHRGSGKSTELARLARDLGDRFFVVHYPVESVTNPYDLQYVDVVLSLGLQLIRQATEPPGNMPVRREVVEHMLEFTRDITKEVETTARAQGELETELNLKVAKLSTRLVTEDVTRRAVREKVSPRLSDLLDNIRIFAKEVEAEYGRRVLIIVENLDKTDPETAKRLFYGYSTTLTAPAVSVIYTFPIALRHDNSFIQVSMNFREIYTLPNMKVRLRSGDPDPRGLACLRDLLTRRVGPSLFDPEALERLASLSGGLPREVVVFAARACLEAKKAGRDAVGPQEVERAVQPRRLDFQVQLTSEQLEQLRSIRRTKRVENTEAHRALLHNLSVLEYRNDAGVWYDVHPVIEPLLGEET